MSKIKPIYLIALILVIVFVVYLKISNPYREFSTSKYWENATLQNIKDIPDEALEPDNKNGPVLMWAAIGSTNTEILEELVVRGSQINESDGVFRGTPLTGAAGYTKNPKMIDALIRLGADINKTVHNNETALMIAAQYNKTPGVVTTLLKNGARLDRKSDSGKTALDYAKQNNNEIAVKELERAGA